MANDEALIANGRIAEIVDAEGHPQKLVASPVKFDDDRGRADTSTTVRGAHRRVLRELGIDDDRLIELKIAGAITWTAVPISYAGDGTVRDRLIRAADAEIAERGIESIQMEAVAMQGRRLPRNRFPATRQCLRKCWCRSPSCGPGATSQRWRP